MLLFSLFLFVVVLTILAISTFRGLSRISEILEIDETAASTPARSTS